MGINIEASNHALPTSRLVAFFKRRKNKDSGVYRCLDDSAPGRENAKRGLSGWLWAIVRKARRAHVPLLSGPGRKFLLSFSPPMLVGALLTIVLYRAGLVTTIPGMWLLLYGTAVVAGGAFSVRIVPVMGICFMLAGTLAIFTPAAWNDWIMAAAFGGLHIAFGVPIAWRHGG